MAGSVTVVNYHHLPGKQLPDASYVYIGRPRGGGALDLGNPIELKDHANDRDSVLEAYRTYARNAWLDPKSALRQRIEGLVQRVKAGEDLKLVCWCAPRKCHGDVLKEAIEKLAMKVEPRPRSPRP